MLITYFHGGSSGLDRTCHRVGALCVVRPFHSWKVSPLPVPGCVSVFGPFPW